MCSRVSGPPRGQLHRESSASPSLAISPWIDSPVLWIQPLLTFISCRSRLLPDSCRHLHIITWWKQQCWLKPPSFYVFTVIYWHYADIFRHESGRCCTLPFFLTYFFSKFHRSIPGSETSPVQGILDKECSTVFYNLLSLLSKVSNNKQLLAIAVKLAFYFWWRNTYDWN